MGHRELRRVPMDFDAPLGKVWGGYINPYHGPLECTACDRTGYNAETKKISDGWYSFGNERWVWVDDSFRYNDLAWCNHLEQDEVDELVRCGRLMHTGLVRDVCVKGDDTRKSNNYMFDRKNRTWIGWIDREKVEVEEPAFPTAEEVNKWSCSRGMGHDCSNMSICVKVRAKRLGVYGLCPICHGDGVVPYPDEKVSKLHDEWEPYEPPRGEGYQLWETCSEGSPTSPVFDSADALAAWCAINATIFASEKCSKEQWMSMFAEEDGVDVGSSCVVTAGYFGSITNKPE